MYLIKLVLSECCLNKELIKGKSLAFKSYHWVYTYIQVIIFIQKKKKIILTLNNLFALKMKYKTSC